MVDVNKDLRVILERDYPTTVQQGGDKYWEFKGIKFELSRYFKCFFVNN